jgi:hypothetical protein
MALRDADTVSVDVLCRSIINKCEVKRSRSALMSGAINCVRNDICWYIEAQQHKLVQAALRKFVIRKQRREHQ